MTIICFDNGSTGSFSIYNNNMYYFFKTPSFKSDDFGNSKREIKRLDRKELRKILDEVGIKDNYDKIICYVERPFLNFRFLIQTISAVRFYEAMLIFLEDIGIKYNVVDSREWQKEYMKGVIGKERKKKSLEIGNMLFPQFKDNKLDDRDSLLMLYYYKKIIEGGKI